LIFEGEDDSTQKMESSERFSDLEISKDFLPKILFTLKSQDEVG